jgi:hypothetical protein
VRAGDGEGTCRIVSKLRPRIAWDGTFQELIALILCVCVCVCVCVHLGWGGERVRKKMTEQDVGGFILIIFASVIVRIHLQPGMIGT